MGAIEEDIFLRQLENTMLNFVSLHGVKDIERAFPLERDKVTIRGEGSIEVRKEKEWVLETDGVNLKTVMRIDGVDFRRTQRHRVRRFFRHLALLCDLMTHCGSLMARHGINCTNTRVLMNARLRRF